MGKILLENSDRVLQEDGSFLIINEDTVNSVSENSLLSTINDSTISVGVSITAAVNDVASTINSPTISLGITITPQVSELTANTVSLTLSYGVTLTPETIALLMSVPNPNPRLVVGCWEIPFKIYTDWDGRSKPSTSYSTRIKPSTSWEGRPDVGDKLLLEDGFNLLLENGDKIIIGQNWSGRAGVSTSWTNRTKPEC
jgi:hypothetical protein